MASRVLLPLLGATGVAASVGTVVWCNWNASFISPIAYGHSPLKCILQHYQYTATSQDTPWEQYVKEHTKIQELYQGKLWQVSGREYGVPASRNMTIYRLKNTKDLVIHSPIALNEEEMNILSTIGEPKIIVLPNESETSTRDLAAYKKRFPSTIVAAPSSVANRMKEKGHAIDTSIEDVFVEGVAKDSGITLIEPDMIKFQESVLDVPLNYGERGLMFGELISNLKLDSGLSGRMLWLAGYVSDGKQPQVPGSHRSWAFKSRNDMLRFFEKLSVATKERDVYRIVTMQHGLPVFFNIPRKFKKIVEGYAQDAHK